MTAVRITVAEDQAGNRLDALLARSAGLSRSKAATLVRSGAVTVDGAPREASYRVTSGELVEADLSPDSDDSRPGPVPPVVYEDEHLLVVDKPPGLVVHPAPGLKEPTLVDAVTASGRPLAARGGPGRPGVVHRLDREVSGLLVLAKTDAAHEALSSELASRAMVREYLALVSGVPPVDRGKIDAPVGRHVRRTKMAVAASGRPSVTWFRVRERFAGAALVELRLETGRTHQIRVHLESIGHPVIGDPVYGRDASTAKVLGLRRPFLHSARLTFRHPTSSEEISLESPLPSDLTSALDRLRGRQ